MKSSAIKVIFVFLIGVVFSCENENDHIEFVNARIHGIMKDVYLWYDHIPSSVNYGSYDNPQQFIEAIRYEVYDKWSFVITADEYFQYFQNAEMIGHGISFGIDEDDKVRVLFLYRNTEAEQKGIKRGWILTKINNIPVPSDNSFLNLLGPSDIGRKNNLTFINDNGLTVEIQLTKQLIEITPVLHYELINLSDSKIGYIVFQDFISNAVEELDEAFNYFKNENINEIIIDLRYNGGGYTYIADYIAGWLAGNEFGDEIFTYYEYNNKYSNRNSSTTIPVNANAIGLDRVFFITTGSTASASELLITGIKPYTNSTIIAGSTTEGKPVGMQMQQVSDYMVFPISFKYSNSLHEGDFYSGLIPDIVSDDDITRDFGDPQESSLKAILDYINGSIPLKSDKSAAMNIKIVEPDNSIGQFLKAF